MAEAQPQGALCHGRFQPPCPTCVFLYYALMTVVVSVIAVRLIWMPLARLLQEVTTILGNTILYILKRLGLQNKPVTIYLASFFKSKTAPKISSYVCSTFLLYYTSVEILYFLGCVISYLLPDVLPIKRLKEITLNGIGNLMKFIGSSKRVSFNGNVMVQFYDPKSTPFSHATDTIRPPIRKPWRY